MSEHTPPPAHDAERRQSLRAPTLRRAVVSLLTGRGSIVRGSAVDISPDGLRVSVPVRQMVGNEVEVFLPPRSEAPGEAGLTVRGRIQWENAENDGSFSLGIRLYQDAPPTEEITSRVAAEALMARVREELALRAAGGPETVVELMHLPPAEEARTSRRRLWPFLLLFVALLFVVTLLLLWALRGGSGAAAPRAEQREETAPDAASLDLAQRTAQDKNMLAAMGAFARLARDAKTPTTRLIAELGYADTLRAQGRAWEARESIAKALEHAGDAPREWQEVARDFRDDLANAGATASAPPLLVDALAFLRPTPKDPSVDTPPPNETTPSPAAEPPPAATAEPVRLEVSRSRYVLTLYRGKRAVASYAVGLGIEGATPTGDFTIANKLIDPDWFNRGESVKAGDPRNPLGKHWMGLGTAAGPTSYGIHETREADSIGANRSRGCVRMRPVDATALFQEVEIGTPVRIVE